MDKYCCFKCPKSDYSEKKLTDLCPDCNLPFGFPLNEPFVPKFINRFNTIYNIISNIIVNYNYADIKFVLHYLIMIFLYLYLRCPA